MRFTVPSWICTSKIGNSYGYKGYICHDCVLPYDLLSQFDANAWQAASNYENTATSAAVPTHAEVTPSHGGSFDPQSSIV